MKNDILSLSDGYNPNYLAQIVKLDKLEKHPNADKLQIAVVANQKVITGLDAKIGDTYVYFPIECRISEAFLSETNSFENKEKNKDVNVRGYVHNSGRVRMLKLRDIYSEGLIMPFRIFQEFVKTKYKKTLNWSEDLNGFLFDNVCREEFVRKYVPRIKEPQIHGVKSKGKIKKYASKLVEGQFQFHPDTEQLKRNVDKVDPEDYISITNKIHGANFLVAHVLTKRKLSVREKIAKFFGVKVKETEYGNLYASRTVIKNSRYNESDTGGFYKEDIWKKVSEKLFPLLDDGITATGEVFGYTQAGAFIQKPYDYGLPQGEQGYVVFNLTYTSPQGNVFVLSYPQLVEYCTKKKIPIPECYYYGKAKDLFPEISTENHWHENFLAKLIERFLEKKCHICKNDVWAEGIVLRVDKPNQWLAQKLKSLNFLKKESESLDAGDAGIEETNNEE